MDFFGNRNIHDIDLIDIEDFFKQLPLNKNPLSTSYLKKHLNLLKKVFISAGRTNIRYPTFRGKKSEPRGYFNKVEYHYLTTFFRPNSISSYHFKKDKNGDIDSFSFFQFQYGISDWVKQ